MNSFHEKLHILVTFRRGIAIQSNKISELIGDSSEILDLGSGSSELASLILNAKDVKKDGLIGKLRMIQSS